MSTPPKNQSGFTVVEMAIGLIVLAVVALSFLGLFVSLVHSAVIAKEKAVALTLATNQMEYLKSLPYDSLAVVGGGINAPNPLPASIQKTMDGVQYTVTTTIKYVDDAYDGCGTYPSLALEQLYCRNYPPPAGAPSPDQNPADYKIVHVTVSGPSGSALAAVDTEIAARVAETASTTGALFVNVVDNSGAPVSGATVQVTDTALTPAVNVSDSTDSNGMTIFYSLPPDSSNYNYTVTASKPGYSTLTTIVPSGSLQPTYPSQNVFTQKSSFVTLTLRMQGPDSLVLESTNTDGTPLPAATVYLKGGYKKYTAQSNTAYYYDTMTPTDTRPVTDANGLAGLSGLVPGPYYFCGDNGATGCSVGGTTYYLAAAVPYSGPGTFDPVIVPTYDPSAPPAVTYSYNGVNYYQKVRLMLTTNPNFPRLSTMAPDSMSLSQDPVASFGFSITGVNLPCTGSATNCGTSISFTQGSNTYTASCTGTGGTQLNCTANFTGATTGLLQMKLTANGYTLALPASPLRGGISVVP